MNDIELELLYWLIPVPLEPSLNVLDIRNTEVSMVILCCSVIIRHQREQAECDEEDGVGCSMIMCSGQ